MKNLINEIRTRDEVEYDSTALISMISLKRLMDGGAAILAAVKINHHIDIVGPTDINPFVRNILRVLVISYDMFAKIKRAEDLRPWAIIMARAPVIPQTEFDIIPPNIIPM